MTDTIQILGTTLFALAVLHTFSIKVFQRLALKFPEGSVQENLFHLLGEVEIVFGLWAGLLVAGIALLSSGQEAIQYVEGANFTEPVFVFAIMSVAATRPDARLCQWVDWQNRALWYLCRATGRSILLLSSPDPFWAASSPNLPP